MTPIPVWVKGTYIVLMTGMTWFQTYNSDYTIGVLVGLSVGLLAQPVWDFVGKRWFNQ